MIVKINRDTCPANLAFCERCLGRFLEFPEGYERRCFHHIIEDGKDDLTLYIHSGGHDTKLVLDEEERIRLAREGWAYFVDFPVPIYRESGSTES
jgi:hypothetical protein